jgi:hypothetical protein
MLARRAIEGAEGRIHGTTERYVLEALAIVQQ